MSHPYETPDPKTHPWTICETCPGDGKHSQHLGSFTADEFAEQFDDLDAGDYFAGRYDRRCEDCDGTGKVRVRCEQYVGGETDYRSWHENPAICEPCQSYYGRLEGEAEQRAEQRMGA